MEKWNFTMKFLVTKIKKRLHNAKIPQQSSNVCTKFTQMEIKWPTYMTSCLQNEKIHLHLTLYKHSVVSGCYSVYYIMNWNFCFCSTVCHIYSIQRGSWMKMSFFPLLWLWSWKIFHVVYFTVLWNWNKHYSEWLSLSEFFY